MAPPHAGFRLMREAALRLALESPAVRSLINPRQSTPISYPTSPLNATPAEGAVQPGDAAPEVRLAEGHLSRHFGRGFVALLFSDQPHAQHSLGVAVGSGSGRGSSSSSSASSSSSSSATLAMLRIARTPPMTDETAVAHDFDGAAWQRYGAAEGTLVLVRPDGYVMGRWNRPDAAGLAAALAPFRRAPAADDAPTSKESA